MLGGTDFTKLPEREEDTESHKAAEEGRGATSTERRKRKGCLCRRRSCPKKLHFSCLVLTTINVFLLIVLIMRYNEWKDAPEDEDHTTFTWIVIGLAVCYALYLIEALLFSSTARILIRLTNGANSKKRLHVLKESPPEVVLRVTGFHFESVRVLRGSPPQEEFVRMRKEKYSEKSEFRYKRWVDESDDISGDPRNFAVSKVEVIPSLHYLDPETEFKAEQELSSLKSRLRNADDFQDAEMLFSVKGLTTAAVPSSSSARPLRRGSGALSAEKPGETLPADAGTLFCYLESGRKPLWLEYYTYLVISIFLLAWPWRVAVELNTGSVQFRLRKLISVLVDGPGMEGVVVGRRTTESTAVWGGPGGNVDGGGEFRSRGSDHTGSFQAKDGDTQGGFGSAWGGATAGAQFGGPTGGSSDAGWSAREHDGFPEARVVSGGGGGDSGSPAAGGGGNDFGGFGANYGTDFGFSSWTAGGGSGSRKSVKGVSPDLTTGLLSK